MSCLAEPGLTSFRTRSFWILFGRIQGLTAVALHGTHSKCFGESLEWSSPPLSASFWPILFT